MRVLIVMLSVGFAGTERHAVELANELSRQGHDVGILLRRCPSEPHRLTPYLALRNTLSPRVQAFMASRTLPMLGLWRALLRFRPDIVHAHAERSVRIASRYAGRVPLIGTVHVPFRGRSFARCDGLICLTRAEADRLSPRYPRPLFVIGNWVQPCPRPADAILSARRVEFGLAEQDHVIGTVARLEPEKGIGGLITAFHAANLPASRLLIIGDGTQRAELERHAISLGLQGRVIFTGFRQDVRDLYHLLDAFVLNSHDEPFGLAILEAAAAGLPVIATATTGPLAIAQDLPLELVPPDEPELMAQALARLHPRQTVSYDLSRFMIDAKVRDITDAYRQLIATRRPARCLKRHRRSTISTMG